MKKSYLISALLIFAGLCCGVAYNLIGAYVRPDGLLVEPFYLIPLTYLMVFLGVILAIMTTTVGIFRSKDMILNR